MEVEQETLGKIVSDLEYLKKDVDEIKKDVKEIKAKSTLEVFCEKCLARRIIYWVVAMMGAGVVGAVLALILRSPVK